MKSGMIVGALALIVAVAGGGYAYYAGKYSQDKVYGPAIGQIPPQDAETVTPLLSESEEEFSPNMDVVETVQEQRL